ncbi:ankyrin [Xylariaceae sp. FL1019]|nr:ankyrin [Xylariaceae sp. FL1019]
MFLCICDLPNEVIHQILVDVVRDRRVLTHEGVSLIGRALRCRLYSLFKSGLLDGPSSLGPVISTVHSDCAFLERYLTYRALHNTKPASLQLITIRKVAERMLEMRTLVSGQAPTQKALKDITAQICHAALLFPRAYDHADTQPVSKCEVAAGIDENGAGFKRSLLAAAAYTNDIHVARELLTSQSGDNPSITNPRRSPPIHMHRQIKRGDMPVLPIDPYSAAAYKGNVGFLSYLIENETEKVIRSKRHTKTIIYHAAWGNQIGPIDLVLGPYFNNAHPDYERLRDSLIEGLEATTDVDVFKRIFEVVRNEIKDATPHAKNQRSMHAWLTARIRPVAEKGALDLLEYLFQLGASVDGGTKDIPGRFWSPICGAALKCQQNAVRWLLEKGAPLGTSLHAAVVGGSPKIVQLLLDHGAMEDQIAAQEALLEAMRREDEILFRLLVANGAKLFYQTSFDEVVKMAEEQQLYSMRNLLQEHRDAIT